MQRGNVITIPGQAQREYSATMLGGEPVVILQRQRLVCALTSDRRWAKALAEVGNSAGPDAFRLALGFSHLAGKAVPLVEGRMLPLITVAA